MPEASQTDITPEERRRLVAAILVRGVVRHRQAAALCPNGEFSRFGNKGLEVVSKTRLSVTGGLATEPRDRNYEVRDE